MARARKAWRRRQLGFDPARLVFIDESSAKTNLTRLRGRTPRGKRLYASAPQGHWQTTTMICSMRLDGSTACMTVDGATDTEVFRIYVRQVLCPTLRAGYVVIMDNLSPHKSAQTLSLIQQLGVAVLFLPAYSPDLNPIEKMWSKLKEMLRSLEARSKPSLIEAIASALEAITVRVWHHQVHLPKALSKMTGIFTSAPRALLGNYFGRWYSFRK